MPSKLQKPELGSDVSATGSSSREESARAEEEPAEQKAQEVELEVVIEEMPKWKFMRVCFCPFVWFLCLRFDFLCILMSFDAERIFYLLI